MSGIAARSPADHETGKLFPARFWHASKTVLNDFTIHLAQALGGTPIQVNPAHPGWVKTDRGGPAAPLDVSQGSKW